MTITIGSWILPFVVTLIALAASYALTPSPQPSGYFPDFGPAIVGALLMLLAVIVSLSAWLLWALVLA